MKRNNFAKILATCQLVFIMYSLSFMFSMVIYLFNNNNINQENNIKNTKTNTNNAYYSLTKAKTETNAKVKDEKMHLNHVDKYILMKIAMAEAEGESTEGKALVMLVVLNRVASEKFPNSIEKVVFQKGQFSPISNGRYDKVEPDTDCQLALNKVKNGWNESRGALYFTSEKGDKTWHHRNLKYLFTYENHRFYK